MDTDINPRRSLERALLAAMASAGEMQWGKDDCALWCANILKDALGYDGAERFRGRYRTRLGARRVLGKGARRRAAGRRTQARLAPDQGRARAGRRHRHPDAWDVPVTVICRAPGWFVARNEMGGARCRRSSCSHHVGRRLMYSIRQFRHGLWRASPDAGARGDAPIVWQDSEGRPRADPERVLRAEPISTAIGLTALITSIGASAAVAGAIGGAIVGVAISVGVNYAVSALTRSSQRCGADQRGESSSSFSACRGRCGGGAAVLNSQAIKYNERQAIPSKRIIYGTAQVGGALFFEDGQAAVSLPGLPDLRQEDHALQEDVDRNARDRFVGLHAEHDPVADRARRPTQFFGAAAGFVSASAKTTRRSTHLLARDFTELDSEFRQRGIATVVVRYDYGADFDEYTALWGQTARPNPLWLVDGIAIRIRASPLMFWNTIHPISPQRPRPRRHGVSATTPPGAGALPDAALRRPHRSAAARLGQDGGSRRLG
jgi:hypothetical protein